MTIDATASHSVRRPRPFATLCFCALAALSCRSESEEVARDDAIRYHLNQGHYESAISLLKDRLNENPHDDSAKVLLASAYSGSVGINTIDCFEVLRPKLFDHPLSKTGDNALDPEALDALLPPLAETTSDKKAKAIRTVEKELLKFAAQSADALEVAFRLPHTPENKRDRIVLSLSILADIPEGSGQYLTAQLYQGILSAVQFMNYFRDAVPAAPETPNAPRPWYLSLYCQMDFGILLPNLSQSVDYLAATFSSLERAGRKSQNPLYSNLAIGKTQLAAMNNLYLQNQDIVEFADWSLRASKESVCDY